METKLYEIRSFPASMLWIFNCYIATVKLTFKNSICPILIKYSWACISCQLLFRHKKYWTKTISGELEIMSSNLYGRHHKLVKSFEVSVLSLLKSPTEMTPPGFLLHEENDLIFSPESLGIILGFWWGSYC